MMRRSQPRCPFPLLNPLTSSLPTLITMKKSYLSALLATSLALTSGALNAQIVTITASGPITNASAGNTFTYDEGDRVSLTVTYDLSTPLIDSYGDTTIYGGTSTFVFGDSTFSGDASIRISINNANHRDSFLVKPEFDTSAGNSSFRPMSADVTYIGPVDLTDYGFATGGFAWLDGHLPEGTFVSGSLASFDPDDLSLNSQYSSYRTDFSDSGTNNFLDYTFDTMSVSVSAVPEPSTYALMLGGALGLGGMWHRVRRRQAAQRSA